MVMVKVMVSRVGLNKDSEMCSVHNEEWPSSRPRTERLGTAPEHYVAKIVERMGKI